MIVFFLFVNSNLLFSKNYHEIGLNDPSITGVFFTKSEAGNKICQTSAKLVKFDILEAAFLKIGIYNKKTNW